jgi:copper(I)-binding protein
MHFLRGGAPACIAGATIRRVDGGNATLRCRRGLGGICAIAFALWFRGAAGYGLLTVNQPWAKPGARSSEAYMVLTSSDGARLVGVRSGIAARVSVRGKTGRVAAALELPPGRSVSLRPGAERIALSRLSRPLKLGDRVPLTLTVETRDGARRDIAVNAEVRNESPVDAELRAHRH